MGTALFSRRPHASSYVLSSLGTNGKRHWRSEKNTMWTWVLRQSFNQVYYYFLSLVHLLSVKCFFYSGSSSWLFVLPWHYKAVYLTFIFVGSFKIWFKNVGPASAICDNTNSFNDNPGPEFSIQMCNVEMLAYSTYTLRMGSTVT